ncbi:membrane bound O-acyl transferase family-domain-containing protein [Collybia nuda]|uniref:Membrane bound O-acyl transferase family-domain-containing protein n=1 Tax=Collybia nuda TaxID=64659 RepID=A0A9P6CDA8_9AGAR|nr:membrane bound O-acyl transferase family-domain-containing protein [Collybia nuda]
MMGPALAQRPPLPIFQYLILPDIALCCLILIYPSKLWRFSAVAVFAYFNVKALSYTTGDGLQDYAFGCAVVAQLFTAIHLLCLTNPLRDFRHKHDVIPPSQQTLLKRLWWSFGVNHGPRGIGWNYQAPNLQPAPTEERWQFVRSSLWRALRFFILVDLAQSYIHLNPLFSTFGSSALSITAQGYVLRCLNIAAYSCTPYGMLNMQYSLLSAVAVSLDIVKPEFWIRPYGYWTDAYTIRRFWGRTWHQMMRRFLSSHGKFIARTLGFRPGSQASSSTQLFAAFTLSGIIHSAGGDAMVGMKYLGASFPFFFAQAVGITIEDIVIAVSRKMNVQSSQRARLVGYLWVFWWFSVTTPWYIDWSVEAGISRSELFPVSPIRFILNYLHVDVGQFFP